MKRRLFRATTMLLLGLSAPAAAEIPHSVKAMIDEAIRVDDPAKVDTVIEFAKATNPQSAAEIDAIHEAYRERSQNDAARKAEEAVAARREAGIFELWDGKGELGAFRATGNSSNIGLALGVSAERKGIDWEHRIRARIDYTEDDITKRDQYLFAYRPRYSLEGDHFIYGRGQFESDELQGFDARYSLSGGVGYKLINRDSLKFAIEAGPALRITDFVIEDTESHVSGLGSVDVEWKLGETLKLTQDASAFIEPSNATINSVTALEAGVSKGLAARISYAVEHETRPNSGAIETDTLTRFGLVYGF